ncbi:protoporphyrinogen oxidase [Phytoactinopolyspora alkaliphila]|uniref:Coproporphyrinogen III oxidase n=1 Tax=Phytoactinopolyspora alkaliphila TaxID=1783498 RepID=A0A6N9YGM7_9ACTN|nr:protoporphyrinogen oxidase [Phytoactinopolyspora alkaliphila]NED94122.1 protoporphyrinogen oxidase [Phytoactinopolyspora alkaliphila]
MGAPPGGTRVAVVGGGISGMAAAWFLRQSLGDDAELVVLEQRDVVGGHLRVAEVAGLPVDIGAESLLARRPEAVELVRAAGLGDDVMHPAEAGAGIWSRGRIHPMPAGTVMGVPSRASSLTGLLTEQEVAAAQHADEASAAGVLHDDDIAIGRLVAARMGRAVVERVVEPLLGGVYAGHADELSLEATVPALAAAARRHDTLAAAADSLQAARGPAGGHVFAGVDGGLGRIPGAVARAARATVRTGITVRELARTARGWRLVTGPRPAPEFLDVDAVVLAVPAAPSARLLRDVAGTAAAELASIETASMAIVTLAIPVASFPEPPAASGFLVPPVDGHTIKAVTYSSVKWPWLGKRAGDVVVLRASVGRYRQEAELQRDDAELIEAVMTDLTVATGVRGRPVDARVTRWGGALPQYAVGHLGRVRRIREHVSALPGLAVCGAAYDGVGIAACVAAAQAAAAGVAEDVRDGRVRIES